MLWGLYLASGVNYLVEVLVPEHTRQAAFSLFVGLRAENSPKDVDFFKIHGKALQPRTFLGWLALGASIMFASSWLAATLAALLGTIVTALNVLLILAVICGVTTCVVLGFTSLALLACACIAGSTSLAGAIVYVGCASAVAFAQCVRLIISPVPHSSEQPPFACLPYMPEDSNREDTAKPVNTADSDFPATSNQLHGSQSRELKGLDHIALQNSQSQVAYVSSSTAGPAESLRNRPPGNSSGSRCTGQRHPEASDSSTACDLPEKQMWELEGPNDPQDADSAMSSISND